MVHLKSETFRLSEETKDLKKTTIFSSKLIEKDKHIYSIATSYEERLVNISANSIVSVKIEADKLEIESRIEKMMI